MPDNNMAGIMPTILLTRPAPGAAETADALRARLGEVKIVYSPLLSIGFQQAKFANPHATPIFTSRNGVEGFLRSGGNANGPCWCVGEATAQAAEAAGFTPRAAEGDAESLIAMMLASGDQGPFQHYRGAHARGDVAGRLSAAGRPTGAEVVYSQDSCDLSDEAKALFRGETVVIVPLFSPRTAAQFASAYTGDGAGSAPVFAAVMSIAVGEELAHLKLAQVEIASRPDADAMLAATTRLFNAALRLEGGPGAK